MQDSSTLHDAYEQMLIKLAEIAKTSVIKVCLNKFSKSHCYAYNWCHGAVNMFSHPLSASVSFVALITVMGSHSCLLHICTL